MQPLGKQSARQHSSSFNEEVEENEPIRAPASAVNAILGRLGLAREQNESESDESALAHDLADPSWTVRVEAIQKLGKIGKQAPSGLLLAGLNDEQSSVRAAAARALARNPRQAALPALVAALGDTEWIVRAEAARALGKLRELAPLEPLLLALKDKDAAARAAVVEALGEIGTEAVLEPLQAALRDEDWSVREAATLALSRLEKEATLLPLLNEPLESDSPTGEPDETDVRPDSLETFSPPPPPSDSFARWLERIEAHQEHLSAYETGRASTPVPPRRKNTRGPRPVGTASGKSRRRKQLPAKGGWPRKIGRLAEGLVAAILIACLIVAWVAIEPQPHPTQVGSSSNNNQPVFTIYHGHESSVEKLAWSPDGHTIASADARGDVQIWQASTGRTLFTYPQRGAVLALIWNRSNEVLAAYGEQNRMLQVMAFILDTVPYAQTLFQQTRLPGIPSVAAWSPDGQTLAFDEGNGSIEIWNVVMNVYVTTIQEKQVQYSELAWSPDSNQLATVSTNGQLKIWDAFTGRNIMTLPNGQLATAVTWISCGPSGNSLFFVNARGDIMELWYKHANQQISPFLPEPMYNFASSSSITISVLRLSPGKSQLLLATSNGAVQARDATTGNLIYVYTGHSAQVNDLAWSPDGRHIASASLDTTVQIWQEP